MESNKYKSKKVMKKGFTKNSKVVKKRTNRTAEKCKKILNHLTQSDCISTELSIVLANIYGQWARVRDLTEEQKTFLQSYFDVNCNVSVSKENYKLYLSDFSPVTAALSDCDLPFMKVLVKFGITDIRRDGWLHAAEEISTFLG